MESRELKALPCLSPSPTPNCSDVSPCDNTHISFINFTFINFFYLIEYKTSVLMYKVKYKLLPNSSQRFFYSNEDSLHNTRQRDKFKNIKFVLH